MLWGSKAPWNNTKKTEKEAAYCDVLDWQWGERMTLAVVEKESHSSNGNAEWAGPCARLPFPSPGCYPGHPGSVKQHNLWLYLVPTYNIGIFKDFKLRKIFGPKNVFEFQHSHSRVRFIKYIFFSFQKSFHMQHKKTLAQVIKTINNKSTYVGA